MNRILVLVIGVTVVIGLVTYALVGTGGRTSGSASANGDNPARPGAGFASAMAGGWKHGEGLASINVVTDTDRQDLCIVAGRIVGGPYDGQVAAWGVSPCLAVSDPTQGMTIAANDIAAATNSYGSAASDSAPIAAFRNDLSRATGDQRRPISGRGLRVAHPAVVP